MPRRNQKREHSELPKAKAFEGVFTALTTSAKVAAKKHDVTVNTIYNWKRAVLNDDRYKKEFETFYNRRMKAVDREAVEAIITGIRRIKIGMSTIDVSRAENLEVLIKAVDTLSDMEQIRKAVKTNNPISDDYISEEVDLENETISVTMENTSSS